MPSNGIDVSEAQRAINWPRVASHYDFAIIRASQDLIQDKFFVINAEAALKVGLKIGFYHAFLPNTDPVKQAEFYLKITQPYLKEMSFPLVLDIERVNKQSAEQIASNLFSACMVLEQASGYKPIIYTNPNYWKNFVAHSHDDYFQKCPLYVAAWTTAKTPIIPKPWTDYLIWQYQEGHNGSFDLDRAK